MNKAYLLGLMLENDSYKDVYNDKVYGQAALIASSYNEKLYGYPVTFNMPVMVYNSKLAGAVDTFDEIKEYNDNYEVTEDNKSVRGYLTLMHHQCFLIIHLQEDTLI